MHKNLLSPPIFPFSWASEWGEDQYGLWMIFNYQNMQLTFRWIPPGTFMMGSGENEKGRYPDEYQRKVTISHGFWLADTTITQVLWHAVMGNNPSQFKQENNPVEQVSWDDCRGFISKFNQLHSDLAVRLPWEAEWEYACRAGKVSSFNFGELTLDKANYNGSWADFKFAAGAKKKTVEVKSFACNDWGLYQMHGNVWEWCEDVWQEQLGHEEVTNPWRNDISSDTAARRVVRGGSWFGSGQNVRSAVRSSHAPVDRDGDIGLRLALGHSELR